MRIDTRKLLGTIIGVAAFAMMVIALTYAYYTWKSEETLVSINIDDSYFYCESGLEKNIDGLYPVLDYRSGGYQTFKVNNIGRQNTTFSLTMNILDIDEELKDESFKYKLVVDRTGGTNNCADTNNNSCVEVGSGNFKNAKVGMNTLVETVNLPNDVRYQYYLFLYIDGNMENDSAMQTSSMTAILEVCEVVVFLDYDFGNVDKEFLKVSGTYAGLPSTAARNNTVITYNSNGGSAASSGTINYTFDGWYTAKDGGGSKVTASTEVTLTTNHTLYANWIDTGAITLPTTTRTGYTFGGWYSDSGLTNKVGNAGDSYKPETSVTLYAKWTANKYKITTTANGGTITPSTTTPTYDTVFNIKATKTVTVTGNVNGTGATVGSATSKAQTFAGWTSTSGLNTSTAKYGTASNAVTTSWSNGSTKVGSTTTYLKNLTPTSGGTVAMVANWTPVAFDLPTVTKTGHTCTWNTASDGNGTSYASGASYTPSATSAQAITMYARCTANNYTVTYDYQNNVYAPDTSNWTFQGSSALNSNYTYNDTTGVAVYSTDTQYTGVKIPLNSDKKTNTNYELSVMAYRTSDFSGSLRVYATTLDSYGGVLNYNHGINITTSSLTTNSWNKFSYKFNSGAWTSWEKIYIDYDTANQGPVYISDIRLDEYSTSTKSYGSTYGTLPTPTRTGYTFNGWYTSASGGTQVTSSSIVSITSNQTLYAHWTPNTYTVYYDANGGTGAPADQNFVYNSGASISTTVPTRTGYTFSHWSFNELTMLPGDAIPLGNGSFTLTAQWTANTYTVTLNNQSATTAGSSSVVATYGSAMPSITLPSKTGYSFTGYYSTTTAINMVTSLQPLTTSAIRVSMLDSSNGWNLNSTDAGTHIQGIITVTDSAITSAPYLDCNDWNISAKAVQTSSGVWTIYIDFDITNNMVTAINSIPYDTDYRFIDINGLTSNSNINVNYLTKDGKKYYNSDGSSAWDYDITSNTVLYAGWKLNNYTISLDTNGGSSLSNINYNIETATFKIETPTRTGYTFSHWKDNQVGLYSSIPANVQLDAANNTLTFKNTVSGNAYSGLKLQLWSTSWDFLEEITDSASRTGDVTRTYTHNRDSGQYILVFGTNGSTSDNKFDINANLEKGKTYRYEWKVDSFTDQKAVARDLKFYIEGDSHVGIPQDIIPKGSIGNRSLTAQWTANQYTVSFNANGGSVSTGSKTVTYGSTYGDLPTPTSEFYDFTGWYTAASGGTKITSSSTVSITSNQTLYAQWTPKTFTITYYDNGGSGGPGTQNFVFGSGSPISTTVPTRTGYDFSHWEWNGVTFNPGDAIPSGWGSFTLTAQWDINSYGFNLNVLNPDGSEPYTTGEAGTIQMSVNDGEYTTVYNESESSYTYGTVLKFKNFSPGTGRYLSSVTGATESGGVWSVTITSVTTVEFYTAWNSYSFNLNILNPGGGEPCNGDAGTVQMSVNDGEYTTVANEPAGSYTYGTVLKFKNFSPVTGTNLSNVTGATESGGVWSVTITSSTIVEFYTAWNTYTISFNANGGSVSTSSKTVTYASTYGDLPTPTSEFYDFTGWYTSASGGTQVTSSSVVSITSNQTLYAQWTPKTFTITYNDNGGSGGPGSQNFVFGSGSPISTTVPTRTGYTFSHWEFNGVTFNPGDAIPSGWGSFTLTAQWNINSYGFNLNILNPDGSEPYSTGEAGTIQMSVNDGAYTTLYNEPTSSYTYGTVLKFKNFSPGTGRYLSGVTGATESGGVWSVTITSATTVEFYTAWNSYSFNLNILNPGGGEPCNGDAGTVQMSINDGSYTTVANEPASSYNYGTVLKFKNFSPVTGTNLSRVTGASESGGIWSVTVTGSTTVEFYTAWNTYTVSFNANGGSVSTGSKTVTYSSTYGDLPTPTRSGYSFQGWYTATSGGTKITSSTTVSITAAQTLYAQWKSTSFYAIQSGTVNRTYAPNATAWGYGYSNGSGTFTDGSVTLYGGYGHTNGHGDGQDYWGANTGNISTNGLTYVDIGTYTNNWSSPGDTYYYVYDGSGNLIKSERIAHQSYSTTRTINISSYSTISIKVEGTEWDDSDAWMNVGFTNIYFHN